MKINFDSVICKEKLPSGLERVVIDNLSAEWEFKESDRILYVFSAETNKTEELFRCIAAVGAENLLPPDSGKIIITGCDSNPVYIPKETSPVEWLTTEENIGLPLKIKGLSKAEIAEAVGNAAIDTGLEGYEQHLPNSKSRGYLFRVELARALAAGAEFILINDSITGTRKPLREDLYNLIRKISDEKGIFFLIASSESSENYGFHSINL
ncbi:MAG: hypothetical protein AB9882_05565 [Ignavibacteriaceae bacterium]